MPGSGDGLVSERFRSLAVDLEDPAARRAAAAEAAELLRRYAALRYGGVGRAEELAADARALVHADAERS